MAEESIAEATSGEDGHGESESESRSRAQSQSGDGSGHSSRRSSWPPERLLALRTTASRRLPALVVAVAVGLGLAWFHWVGLLAAGVLVGLVSKSVPRAVGAGLIVGVLSLVATVLASPSMSAAEFLALSPPTYVAIASGLALPAWGSLIRGLG